MPTSISVVFIICACAILLHLYLPTGETVNANPFLDKVERLIAGCVVVRDNSAERQIPNVELSDGQNTIYFAWYASGGQKTRDLCVNGHQVPTEYDGQISRLIFDRIEYLRKRHMESLMDSIVIESDDASEISRQSD